MNDMTPAELLAGLKSLAIEVGPKASANIYLAEGDYMSGHATANLRPEGTLGKVSLSIKFSSWDEILPGLRAKWEEHRDLHEANIIREMAMAIIRITMDRDECRDADLRCDFDRQDVGRYADRAAALATEMGGKGPFIVIRTDEGNGGEVSE
jgi:hypothetical protein